LRKNDGDAGRQTNRLYTRDPPDFADELGEPLRGHDQRIAAAHDDVTDFRVVAQILERVRELFERAYAASGADQAAAGAEATIDGASIGREEERAIGVATDEVRRDLVIRFAEWVAKITGDLAYFCRYRDDLPPNGARGVVGADERQVVRGRRNGKATPFG
jgi:hypothetical protein